MSVERPARPGTRSAGNERIDWADVRRRVEAAGAAVEAANSPADARAAAVLKERARRLARPREIVPAQAPVEVVAFTRGGEKWAIEARHILSVVRVDSYTPLPPVEPDVAGVLVWRGHPILLRDLVPGQSAESAAWALVLGARHAAFALLADTPPELQLLPRAAIAPPAETATNRTWLFGITADARTVIDGGALLREKIGGGE